jgi:hypothetical protein
MVDVRPKDSNPLYLDIRDLHFVLECRPNSGRGRDLGFVPEYLGRQAGKTTWLLGLTAVGEV